MDIEEFLEFIKDMNLADVLLLGKKISWFQPGGSAKSRLDCFLVSEDLNSLWNITDQWVSLRDVSDHCPVILRSGISNWGPKSFRFNNCWT